MQQQSFSTVFRVDQTPQEVFDAINNTRGWWSGEIEGVTDQPGAEFTYRVENIHYSKQRITEFIPGQKVVWHVTDAALTFTQDQGEWVGTDIVFEIASVDGQTELRFTHTGLVPAFECYHNCSNAWNVLVGGNLRKLIQTGETQPWPW